MSSYDMIISFKCFFKNYRKIVQVNILCIFLNLRIKVNILKIKFCFLEVLLLIFLLFIIIFYYYYLYFLTNYLIYYSIYYFL